MSNASGAPHLSMVVLRGNNGRPEDEVADSGLRLCCLG
jgi:hypothetical protein